MGFKIKRNTVKATDLESIRTETLNKIDAWTKAAITGGFVSSANGVPYTYDSEETDQKNITLMQTVSHSERFATSEYQGLIPIRAIPSGASEKTILYLTTEQMDLLVEDLALHIGKSKQHGWELQSLAKAATTAESLKAIAW